MKNRLEVVMYNGGGSQVEGKGCRAVESSRKTSEMGNLAGDAQDRAWRHSEAARYRDLASMYKRQGQNFRSIEYFQTAKKKVESTIALALSMLTSANVRKQ